MDNTVKRGQTDFKKGEFFLGRTWGIQAVELSQKSLEWLTIHFLPCKAYSQN